jgi:hypothetical protein
MARYKSGDPFVHNEGLLEELDTAYKKNRVAHFFRRLEHPRYGWYFTRWGYGALLEGLISAFVVGLFNGQPPDETVWFRFVDAARRTRDRALRERELTLAQPWEMVKTGLEWQTYMENLQMAPFADAFHRKLVEASKNRKTRVALLRELDGAGGSWGNLPDVTSRLGWYDWHITDGWQPSITVTAVAARR